MSIFQRSGASEKQQQQELPELKSESKGWKAMSCELQLALAEWLEVRKRESWAELTIDNNVTTPVNVTGAPVTNTVANHAEKPEKFNGQNFKRWQQKMFFYLTTLNLALFLKETAPQVEPPREGQPSNAQAVPRLPKNYRSYWNASTKLRMMANMVEHVGLSSKSNSKGKGKDKRKNEKKSKGKAEYLAPKAGIMPKRVTPRHANMVNNNMDMIAMVSDVIAMISEVNMVGVDNGEKLYMGNSATTDIKGEGDVILKMTSEKEIKLTNSDKFVLSKNQMYVGKGYVINVMDPNLSLGKICLGKDVVVISSDKVEGSEDWNSLEFQDTANTYDGEINLGVEENMISNEYVVKLCLEHEVKRANKVVKNELIVALRGKIYFVKFIINPEEDDVEPGVIFGRSFLRMTKAITDFESNDDWDHLLDFNIDDIPLLGEEGLPPFACKMGKSGRNKKWAMENLNFFYQDIGTSSSAGGHLTQEEVAKEAIAIRIIRKFALLEKERPIIETMAYHDKYKKILDEVWKDKVELDGKIVKEEEDRYWCCRGFLRTIGGIFNTSDRLFSTFDGFCHQTFRAARSDIMRNAESDSDDEEGYQIKRNKLREAESDEEIFTLVAWIRAFNINEPNVYDLWPRFFYSTYEFDKVCADDELQTKKIIKFRLGRRAHSLTLLEFARRLGLYHANELEEDCFNVYFEGGLRSDEHFNAQDYWLSISREDNLGLSRSHTSTIKKPILRVIHKMITYGLCQRTTGVLTEDVVRSLSALISCRDLDTTTLRDLIDSNSKHIPEDPQLGVPRVGIPRPPRASMQDFVPMQGAYNPPGYAQLQYDQYYQQYPPPPPQYQQQQQDDDEYFLELRSEKLQISHSSLRLLKMKRGCEYVSSFANLCAKHEIRHEFIVPYSPQQNGISKRKNRTLKENQFRFPYSKIKVLTYCVHPEEVKLISHIPISSTSLDKIVWHYQPKGNYTVNSGYYQAILQCEVKSKPEASSSSTPNKSLWKQVWNLKTLSKIIRFWWKACSNSLVTYENLSRRGCYCLPVCPICCIEIETVKHVLFDCSWTKVMWFGSSLGLHLNNISGPIVSRVQKLLDMVPSNLERINFHTSLANIAWQIWKSRNEYVFSDVRPCPSSTISRLNCISHDFNSVFPSLLPIYYASVDRDESLKSLLWWIPPPSTCNRVKLNCDASWKLDRASSGIIVRDSTGSIILCSSEIISSSNPLTAELLAIRSAYRLALTYGWQNVSVESDCKAVILLTSSEGDPPWSSYAIVRILEYGHPNLLSLSHGLSVNVT
ncbi:reverse transcriptase domain-containing protein [Tanacetum coccineum]